MARKIYRPEEIIKLPRVKPTGYVPGYESFTYKLVLPQKLVQALCEILT